MNPFLNEYTIQDAVKRYIKASAGRGIEYLLSNIYGPIYLKQIEEMMRLEIVANGLRFLEFGCGGGMHMIYLINSLRKLNIKLETAYGTDFSHEMIKAARAEAKTLDPKDTTNVNFVLASNETLQNDLCQNAGSGVGEFHEYFHFILGVDTFRYSLFINQAEECARNCFNMLVKGGRIIIIDMNDKFPYFLKTRLIRQSGPQNRCDELINDSSNATKKTIPSNALPTLEQYAAPIEKVGFKILRKDNISWVPHSAGLLRFWLSRILTPILDKIIPSYAMRSLIIARKPS